MLSFQDTTISSATSCIAVAFILVYILRFIFERLLICYTLRHVPGPSSASLLWGEEWNLFHSDPGSLYVDWHAKFGKVVKFTGAFGYQIISITDPIAMTYIVGEGTYQFPKPEGVRAWFKALLGEGILWVEGKEAHEKQRRALAPALSPQSIRGLMHVFYENAGKMTEQLSKRLDMSRTNEIEVNLADLAAHFSLDTIGQSAFCYDFKCLSGDSDNSLSESLIGLTNSEKNLSSFYMRALFWIFPSILSMGKKGEMIRWARKELGDIVSRMWKDAKIVGDHNDKTFLSIMLRAEHGNCACPMSEEDIVTQMRTIISAGYEPVSASITWILYELAVNSQLQNSLREEVSTVGEPSFDKLNNGYPLLDAILRETLRVHPPILENHHVAAETVVVPLSGPLPGCSDSQLIIPKGTIVLMPVNVVQKDPEIWGSDADSFKPERWLDGKGPCHDLFSFSKGPRSCIGKSFAFAEIKSLVVTLVQHFSFSCSQEIEAFQSFVVRPRAKGQDLSILPVVVSKI